ncbi:MAG: 4-hydroxy-tetrahydrodipicolinate reductase [Gemmatimonadota bacterium]|nr:4-hydroxy-tetrahydrodipicolinate reductase [Gemmatimonadota bacterium]
MSIRVCVAGVTGWTGSAIARAILASDDFELAGAVARSAAGRTVADALDVADDDAASVTVTASVSEALATATDVMIDYTHPTAVLSNVRTAIDAGTHVVVGTSGLSADEYEEIDRAARARPCGVVAAGNFSITAALLKHFAGIAARHIPHWEIVDLAHAGKPDAPSGTARELAEYLGGVARNEVAVPTGEILGTPETRGATIGGAQVHSIRLPGYVIGVEALFGLPDERLTIRHDAGAGATPYVAGTLLAAARAPDITGLVRGLDALLFDRATANGET